MKKRLLSALLALVMVLTMLPATVFAASGGGAATGTSQVNVAITWQAGPEWKADNQVTIAIPVTKDSTTTNVTVTATAAEDSEGNITWSATCDDSNYTPSFDGSKLVLKPAAAGGSVPAISELGQAVVTAVTSSSDSTVVATSTGAKVTVTTPIPEEDDDDEDENPGANVPEPTKPDWTRPATNTPADASHNKMTATFIKGDSPASDKTDGVSGAPGWYIKDTTTKKGYTSIYRITSGYLVGTTYYYSLPNDWNGSSVTVIGNGGTINVPAKRGSVTVDVYPNGSGTVSLTINGGSDLTGVTVKDSRYKEENRAISGEKVTVSVSGTWATGKATTLTLTDVDVDSSGISMPNDGYAHTVNLENCSVAGNISMSGYGEDKNGNKTSATQTLTIGRSDNSSSASRVDGSISVTGNGAKVTLRDVKVNGIVTLTGGNNTNLTVTGSSDIKSVAIDEGDRATATQQLTTIKVDGTFAKVGDITFDNPKVTGKATINVAAGEVGDIKMNAASATPEITVTSGQAGEIEVKSGKVNVSGTYANIAGLALSGNAEFNLTGSNHTVSKLQAKANNVKISVPAEPSNVLEMASATALDFYKGHGIQGGTWKTHPVPAGALHSSLVYQLNIVDDTTYTYYNYDQLNQALVSQFKNADKDDETKGIGNNAILTGVGQKINIADKNSYYELQFKNGKTLWGTMLVAGKMQVKLPTLINTVTVNKWADSYHSDRPAGQMYSTPDVGLVPVSELSAGKDTRVWELNASGGVTSGDVTKLTDVFVKSTWTNNTNKDTMGDVKATLNGTVINLSGAVPAGTSSLTLALTTDAIESVAKRDDKGNLLDPKVEEDVPVTIYVPVTYYSNTKTLQFDTVPDGILRRGVALQFNENPNGVLRLSNGTKYTLNGSGLKERADNITVVDSAVGSTDWFKHNYIEVNVNVSTIKTAAAKQEVIDLLNGAGALYDWKNSPAVREAVNAALASITKSTVDGYIKTAQTNAWRKFNQTSPTATNLMETGYDDAFLVPYLQVNVTAYDPNGTLTATLVPSWRVEVRQTKSGGGGSDTRYSTAFADSKTGNFGNVYVAKTGSALSLGSNVSEIAINSFDELSTGVRVKFAKANNQLFNSLNSGNIYMHQDATYAYKMDQYGTGYLIRHSGGTSLGSVTINTTAPLVKLYKDNKSVNNAGIVAYFDTLQAAVNDAQDKQHIDVDQNYKGSMNVTVTGYARTFTIQANGQNVVLANASGGLVSLNNTGGEYTVQLGRDATAVVDGTSATIAVASVANGSATVSVTSAKSGSTVTVNCTPAAGYHTNSVSVSAHMTTNNTNSAVTVTRISDNVYSFKVPVGADAITVTPIFALGTAASAIPFTDVATNHWAYDAVKYVYDNGLMNGVNTYGTQFGGNQNLTRAMVVTILYRAAGSPAVSNYNNFSDVANNTWYSQAVAWANQNNIVTGYTNGTFQPTWDITRQELATILYRYNTSYKGRATTGSSSLVGYVDQTGVSDWATAGMQWAVGNGIVNGIANGSSTTLSPSGNATRYQAATMLMRYGQGFGL